MGMTYFYIYLELCKIDASVDSTRAITVGSLSFRPCKQALHRDYKSKRKKERKQKKNSVSFLCTTDLYCKQIVKHKEVSLTSNKYTIYTVQNWTLNGNKQ